MWEIQIGETQQASVIISYRWTKIYIPILACTNHSPFVLLYAAVMESRNLNPA